MGRVDAVSHSGWECWFWSRDHLEAHFHVKSAGEWEVKVFFMEDPPYYEVEFEARRIPSRKMSKFLKMVAEKREALHAEWDRKVQVVDP
ncbi:DUF4160 domain-containing protein [Longimicrobium sp.]|jgi:hypothetical protein|uniref:DUF4160 domain-containing protein n=1 Tax=Longimicrobium sp. TaxID=2029185 RepID=UPI0032C24430